ncbi:hypothetical protein PV08_03903 [Exophiala spinifera]|uniref:Alpha N-terminal protein methyltransferase 1 n=1 Tax=Exophiala spinifera TaxID=91928 RepID=A0A0D2BZG4_9EURO|nr:uncharacterized protein PV08_03903 [Exophiala spinifera]KIW16714.1 hypothetical protein PV08_03903 [Exophiala spinifera]
METDTTNDSRISTAEQLAYWNQISADDDGMLGGYPQVSRIDIQFSRTFVGKLRRLYPPTTPPDEKRRTSKYAFARGLETGAGIGRVTFNLLSTLCEQIDIIEPIEKFTDVLTAPDSTLVRSGQLRRVYNVPLQEWTAATTPSWQSALNVQADADMDLSATSSQGRYDLIWNQWCLSHLSSEALVRYFASLIPLLAPDGWIIAKENLSTDAFGKDIYYEEDSSVTRSDQNWRAAFEKAGLHIVKTQLQTGFPKELGLLPVRIYAMRPK